MIKGYIKLLDRNNGLIEFNYGGKYYPQSIKLIVINATNVLNKWFWGGNTTTACLTKTNENVPDLIGGEQITITSNFYNLTAPNMCKYLTGKGNVNLMSIETILCV